MTRVANWIFAIIVVLTMTSLSSCSMSQKVAKVYVKKPTTRERSNEIVEVDWNKVSKKLSLEQGQDIIVTNSSGEQVPYQLITNGEQSPVALIFPVSLESKENKIFQVKTGKADKFNPLVYGRLVPERKDDFTWENIATISISFR